MSTLLRRQFASFILIVTCLVTMVRVVNAAAIAPPNIVSYQGRVLNANGVPVSDTSLSITFKLYDASSGGTCLWSNSSSSCATSTARAVTLSSGLFSENLGDTGASYAAIPNTVFSDNQAVYLGITVGADSEMSPRKRMTAAPYALNAQTIDGIDSTSFIRNDASVSGTTPLVFEGATSDAITTTFSITDPTLSSKTITFKNESGTVALLSDITGGVFTTGTNGDFDNAAVIIGADIAESISNTGFSLSAGSLFVTGNVGVEGMIYTDTGIGIGVSSKFVPNVTGTSDHIELLFPESDGLTNAPMLVIGDASGDGKDWTGTPAITEPSLLLISDNAISSGSLSVSDLDIFKMIANTGSIEVASATGGYLDIHTAGETMTGLISGEDVGIGAGDDLFMSSSGGAIYLNNNTNRPTNVNTGTSTGALSLGGGLGTVAINSSDWDIDATGAITGVSFDANGTGNSISNIENADIVNDSINLDKIADSLVLDAATLVITDGTNTMLTLTDMGTTGDLNVTGTITASAFSGSLSCTDCLDFTALADTLSLDAITSIQVPTGTKLTLVATASPTFDVYSISNAGFASALDGVDGLVVEFGATGVSGDALHLIPSFTTGTTGKTYNGVDVEAFTATTSASVAAAVNGMKVGNLTETEFANNNITSSGLIIGTGWSTDVADADLRFSGSAPNIGQANSSTVYFRDATGNELAHIADTGSTGEFRTTANIRVGADTANQMTIQMDSIDSSIATVSMFGSTSVSSIFFGGGNSSSVLTFGGTNGTTNINDTSGSPTIDIGGVTSDGLSTVNIATNGTTYADTITIGNTASGTSSSINGGTISLGNTATTKSIYIGGVSTSGADTISIATNGTAADTISIGNTASTTSMTGVTLQLGAGGAAPVGVTLGNPHASSTTAIYGGPAWEISTAGVIAMGANLESTAATINLFDDAYTDDSTIDFGGVTNDSANTINISTEGTTADAIAMGNSNAATTIAITGGNDWSIAGTGIASFNPSAAPVTDIVSISSAAGASATSGVDGLSVTFGASGVSGDGIRVTPSYAGGATDFLTFNAMEVAAFSPTNTAGNDTVNGLSIGALTDPGATIFSSAIRIASGWDYGISGESGASPVALKLQGGSAFSGVTAGADVIVTAGSGGSGGGNGGGVTINTGAGAGGGTDGAFYVKSGDGTTLLSATLTSFEINLHATVTFTERLCHSGADAATGVVSVGDCQAAGQADYAEMYPVNTGITYGDIVVPGTKEVITTNGDHIVQLVKSSLAYQGPVSGIVSNNYGDPTSAGYNVPAEENPMPIGLVGRVPVNVTNENGPIHVGDFVTTSSTPGKGMKATLAGRVIGMALSDFTGVEGQVVVQIANTWYMGTMLTNDGTSNILTDNVIVAPVGNASASTTSFDSYGLALRGSAWDGNQAQTVSMMFKNKVTDGTNYRLSVRNTTDSEVAYITNSGTMQVAGDMVVGGKIYPSNLGGIQTEKYIYYDNSAGPGGDFMRTNASGWSTGSYDFAEMFPSTETLVSGDVVVFSETNEHVKRSTKKGEKSIAGIVSTRPGFLAGENTPGSYPIALAGRVPTNVNDENGSITVGDPLTTSSTEGFAMKATKAGPIVGYALEPLTQSQGKIVVFVSAGFWGGDATSSTPGADNRASLFGSSSSESMTTLSMSGAINMNGNAISNIGRLAGLTDAWSIEMDGTIKTEALLKTVIKGQNNQKVETIAVTSPEAIITLSGSSVLKDGSAEVRFFDVNKDFGNVISAAAPVRVIATPSGPVSLYVSEKDQNHFVVKSFGGNASDVEFDWVVTGYRKGYEPVVAPVVDSTTTVSVATPAASPISDSVEAPLTPSTTTPSTISVDAPSTPTTDVPASSTSSSTITVDPSVTNADATASTLSP